MADNWAAQCETYLAPDQVTIGELQALQDKAAENSSASTTLREPAQGKLTGGSASSWDSLVAHQQSVHDRFGIQFPSNLALSETGQGEAFEAGLETLASGSDPTAPHEFLATTYTTNQTPSNLGQDIFAAGPGWDMADTAGSVLADSTLIADEALGTNIFDNMALWDTVVDMAPAPEVGWVNQGEDAIAQRLGDLHAPNDQLKTGKEPKLYSTQVTSMRTDQASSMEVGPAPRSFGAAGLEKRATSPSSSPYKRERVAHRSKQYDSLRQKSISANLKLITAMFKDSGVHKITQPKALERSRAVMEMIRGLYPDCPLDQAIDRVFAAAARGVQAPHLG
ncbi:hypothetical protein HGRIS_006807 [Hohenbuehelia grisea]|uniref:BHLH domain-containing protein n=1 Tax=Hohenbuehelia grisea TaxID=104357 RepID=A0ABR3JA40_9AGAR